MATSTSNGGDPFRGFRFKVHVDSVSVAGFSEVTVSDITVEPVNYREGMDPPYQRALSGLTSYGRVSLKKGMTNSLQLYQWHDLIVQKGTSASNAKRTVQIYLFDSDKSLAAHWAVHEAWPSAYQTSGLNASGAEVMIETLELVPLYVKRMK